MVRTNGEHTEVTTIAHDPSVQGDGSVIYYPTVLQTKSPIKDIVKRINNET